MVLISSIGSNQWPKSGVEYKKSQMWNASISIPNCQQGEQKVCHKTCGFLAMQNSMNKLIGRCKDGDSYASYVIRMSKAKWSDSRVNVHNTDIMILAIGTWSENWLIWLMGDVV